MILLVLACAGAAPMADALTPCPPTPNCVSSRATDTEHAIAPLAYEGDARAARDRMKALVLAMPRTRLESESDDTLAFTFRSRIFRFVDDVHLRFADGVIDVRSASRVGRGDMGVNRARVEEIRREGEAK